MQTRLPANHERIQKALDFAAAYHTQQFREKSGLPYLTHVLDVLKLISTWGIRSEDIEVWETATLHDTREENPLVTAELLVEKFGNTVATWVDHLTFRSRQDGESSRDYQAVKSAHLADFAHKPVEVLVVKIADRITNVGDFRLSDPGYSVKYFHRADGLWQAMEARWDDIGDRFGIDTRWKISNSYSKLNSELEYIRKATECTSR